MPNSVIPFPLDRKRLMTFRIGGRTYPLIIPIPSTVRRERGRVIPIFGQTSGQEAERGRDSLRGNGNQRVGRQVELAYAAGRSDECPDHAARGRRSNMKRFVIGSRSKKALAREGSKKARILHLLKRPKGATLDDLIRATGWQSHSVRGFISGHLVKRMGLKVNSARRSDGQRLYRI